MREFKNELKLLVETPGISGFEQGVKQVIVPKVVDSCNELWEDSFGNLIAKSGVEEGYKIGIYAHMDEVGLIITKISSRGLLSFDMMGMIDERILPGSVVHVCTADGKKIPGVIGNKSKHLQTAQELNTITPYKKMTIDVGARNAEEVTKMGIHIGCQVVFSTACTFYPNDVVLAKALDDRVGCLTLMTVINELHGKLKNTTLYGFFTAQEEIGAKGATSVANGMGLDMFICLDTVPVQNGNDIGEGDTNLGNGPVIRISDAIPAFTKGMISHPEIVKRMVQVAEEKQIPHLADVLHSTYLDSCTAQFTDNGIPGGSMCFPRRYSHTSVEMCDLQDIDYAITLLREIILSLDENPIVFGKKYK